MNTIDINNLNEFVDWVDGTNVMTGTTTSGVDEENRISGKSIRELIQGKLRVPFVTNEDDLDKDKIYFFSSEYAKNLWQTYTDPSSILYNEEKAAELVLYSMDLPAVYRITGLDTLSTTRYIIEGNSESSNATVSFQLGIVDSLNSPQQDSITLKYTVEDESKNIIVDRPLSIDSGRLGETISIQIYQYLKPGRNKVTIAANCNNLTAKTSVSFYVYLVSFSITSNFSGYYSALSSSASSIALDLSVNRSITQLPIVTTIKLRDVEAKTERDCILSGGNIEDKHTGRESSFVRRLQFNVQPNQLVPGRKYAMYINSRMEDSENSQIFNSNHLLYEFEIATQQEEDSRFINIAHSAPHSDWETSSESSSAGQIVLKAVQYTPFSINWGYHTNIQNGESEVNVNWCIRKGEAGSYTYTNLTTLYGVKGQKPDTLRFIPSISASHSEENSFLVARILINNVLTDIAEFPIDIAEKTISISESEGNLKLSAFGKTNSSESRNQWIDQTNNITTTFSSSIPFDNTSGWIDNSLLLSGVDNYAVVNYCPFPSTEGGNEYIISNTGCAFQIDFKPEYVHSESDPIIVIGRNDQNAPRIVITPTSAAFYTGANPKIKTNFKSGERISLAFIFNPIDENSNDSGLLYIVNNGILERSAVIGESSIVDILGNIKIGGSASSVRVYSIRAYRNAIQVKQALSNYMFDNLDDADLLSRNDLYGNQSTIQYDQLLDKQDIILITASDRDSNGLTKILNNASTKQNATVNIERHSTDPSKNFTITDCRIRNHGQSTLSYPITSMKMWFNKSNVLVNNVELTPNFQCSDQQYLGLAKNRYVMKNGAIPANKFVLQANYADSSGAHNGGLLRLIQDTWYNANFGSIQNPEYKLRTAPQLFASGNTLTHDDTNLNEDGTWIEGVYNVVPGTTDKNGNLVYNSTWADKTWPQITGGVQFPYDIRVSADSFPCTVFYQEAGKERQLLGQYVFMDDKKSDYTYGERSIYYTDDPSDPFCLKVENSKKDKAARKVWDNKDVLQVEVVYPNSPLTGYCSKQVADEYQVDPNDDTIIIPVGNTLHSFRDIYRVDGSPVSYYWEQHFELIYPDEDDLEGDKFSPTSDFAKKVEPFLDFLDWITDCKLNYSSDTQWWSAGTYSSTQEAFEATAHDHLDMYKLAAYYIFFLRFGLIDSVERNAQLKTYDGQHWHYEPWDMDIALGCANNGVITYEPPLTRDTKRADGVTYAFSGRTSSQSNTLWDCLENWSYWADQLVPEVAQALYDAGLTYENASKMFDENYVNKWAETLYNDSGHFKYIDAASDPKWMQYLNGARTSHRHWWLSKSMNYYDAKWSCGDFTRHSIEFRIDKNVGGGSIKIMPNADTFFKGMYGMVDSNQQFPFGEGLYSAPISTGVTIPATVNLGNKQFCYIFGATAIEELDMSDMLTPRGASYTDIKLTGSYDSVLGAPIKSLKLGAITTPNIYTNPNETSYTSRLSKGENSITGVAEDKSYDALQNVEHIDINGWIGSAEASVTSNLVSLLTGNGYDRKNVKSIYALGCTKSESFVSSNSGNKFTDLRLPSSVTSVTMNNSSWQNISFWSTVEDGQGNTATYTKLTGVPSSVNKVYFLGSTGKNKCSWDFIKSWITSIETELTTANPGATEDEIEELLYDELETRTLTVQQINWGTWEGEYITYKDLLRLSHFKNETGGYNLKGYVRIHENDITSSQLVKLSNLFGPNVFSIGSTNSNLVVDTASDIIRISSTDANINETTGIVSLNEGSYVTLNANKFLLSGDNIANVILPSNISLNDMEQGKYYWGATTSASNHQAISTWVNFPPYISLEVNNLGRVILTGNIGDGTDYTMYVGVFYKDENDVLQQDELRIDITAATYPTGYNFTVVDRTSSNNESARQFMCNQTIADDIFTTTFSKYLNELVPVYEMYATNRKYEFRIVPQGNYTVPIVYIRYSVAKLNGSTTSDYIGNTSYDELNVNDSTRYDIGLDTYLKYTKDSVGNGISLIVDSLPSNGEMALYQVTARIKMGTQQSAEVVKKANIIVTSDTAVLYTGDYTLPATLKSAYYTLYGSSVGANVYKHHLMSLYGTLQIPSSVSDVDSQTGQSLFTYLPYIETLNLSNCTLLQGALDLTKCMSLTSIDTSGTELGVDFGTGSGITNIVLGSPTSFILKNPTSSNLVPANVTVKSCSNITSLDIRNIPNAKTYTIFEKVFKTWAIGAEIYIGYYMNDNGTIQDQTNTRPNAYYTSKISVTAGHSITMSSNSLIDVLMLDQQGSKIDNKSQSGGSRTVTLVSGCTHIVVRHDSNDVVTQAKVVDDTSETTLFEYKG